MTSSWPADTKLFVARDKESSFRPTKTQAAVIDETLAQVAELSSLGLGHGAGTAEEAAEPWTRYVGCRTRHHEAPIRPDLHMCDSRRAPPLGCETGAG